MLSNFVNISRVYKTELDRTVPVLSGFYNDINLLIELIAGLSKDWLNEVTLRQKKILLKPNWVKHSSSSSDDICLRTNSNFILATLEFVLRSNPAEVIIGDAPIQGCIWERMLGTQFQVAVERLSNKYNIPVTIKDFRRVTFNPKLNKVSRERNPLSRYTIFNLGDNSFLEPVTLKNKNLFRVTQYNPDRLAKSHGPGMHKYCITNELFNADIILSIPKIKTHQKTGITGALKNIVGLNGDKDYLPHHRIGGTGIGGDCYPGKNMLRYWAELMQDSANRNQGKSKYWFWIRMSSIFWKLSFPGNVHHLSAGWFGNDTTWRMVLDLNKIVLFGDRNGGISETQQRVFYNLCDGIIGGQGNGPLNPEPLPLGIVCFSDNSELTDLSFATLMGMNSNKISLLQAAQKNNKDTKKLIYLDGQNVSLADLNKIALNANMPLGWADYQAVKK
jgi:uncharacterized protein (DUF362 family)